MSFFIGLLTVVLVLNCLLLILLVLVQLPKKEAGAGMAFGGAATDALFGAGSGNVLTKVTKYSAVAFFALTLLVAFLQNQFRDKAGKDFESKMEQAARTAAPAATPVEAPATAPSTNINLISAQSPVSNTAPAAAPVLTPAPTNTP